MPHPHDPGGESRRPEADPFLGPDAGHDGASTPDPRDLGADRSCPPADRLLWELVGEVGAADLVLFLRKHVGDLAAWLDARRPPR